MIGHFSLVHVRFLVFSVGQSSSESVTCGIINWDVFFSENVSDPVIDESFWTSVGKDF